MASPNAVVLSDADIINIYLDMTGRKDARTPEKLFNVPPVTS